MTNKNYYVVFLDENDNKRVVPCKGYDDSINVAKSISKLSNMVTKAVYEFKDIINDFYDIGYYYNGKRDNEDDEIGIPRFIRDSGDEVKEFDRRLRKVKFNSEDWKKLIENISF